MRNYLSNTWISLRSVTCKLTLSKRPEVNQQAEKAQGLLVTVVLVVIVVQSTPQRTVKLLEKSVMAVVSLIISLQCADPKIDLDPKAKAVFHIVPISLVVLSKINRTDHIVTSMKLIIKVTLIHMTMNKTLLLLCSTHS